MIKNIKFKISKKYLIISVIILGAVLIFYFSNQKQKAQTTVRSQREILAEKQLKEIDDLRQKSGDQPLSQQQIQKSAQNGRGSLDEIEWQLEELDRLRLLAQ